MLVSSHILSLYIFHASGRPSIYQKIMCPVAIS